MGIEDEKTRAVKAVKRNVTEVQTRKVNAVKRKPAAVDPWSSFLALQQADVLRRGALVNEAGEKDEGWVFREPLDKTDLVWFAWRAEAAMSTLGRWMGHRGACFDVMIGRECLAVLDLQPLRRNRDASARLRSVDGRTLATLELDARFESVHCLVEARQVLWLEQRHPAEASFLVGKRSIGKLHRRPQPGILITTYELELRLEKQATGFERLCAAAMIVFQDGWRLAPREPRDRDGGWSFEL